MLLDRSKTYYVPINLHYVNIKHKIVPISQPAFTCSKLRIETLEQDVKYVQSYNKDNKVFIVNFEQISHPALVFLLLTLNM